MANSFGGNVIYCDTSAAFPSAKEIVGVKYIGASTSSVTIHGQGDSGGPALWSETATTNIFEKITIYDGDGIYVTITGTAAVYIYLRAR